MNEKHNGLFIAYEFNHRQHAKSYNRISGEYARCGKIGDYFYNNTGRRFNTKTFNYCKWRRATNEEIEHYKLINYE